MRFLRGLVLVMTSLVLLAKGVALAGTVGMREIVLATPERGGSLPVAVWYPTSTAQPDVVVGDNAVFRGESAARNGVVSEGRFPLVLIAHGGFRAAPNAASWLASALAAKHYIVVVMRPPAFAGGRATPLAPNELWLRPADMSVALTAVTSDAAMAERIDRRKITAIGFFLGGHAVMELAGARVDAGLYARSCDGAAAGQDCAWLASGGVNLHGVDPSRLERSNHDPRVRSVIAFDPELTGTLTGESLAAISIPVHVLNLGTADTRKGAADASRMASRIPGAKYATVQEATPFSSFAECKPKGASILKEEGGESTLCGESGSAARADIHERLAAMIDAILRDSLATAGTP